MKQIKQYTVDEVDELITKHNKLVITPHCIYGEPGRDYLMGKLTTFQYLEQPYYEIPYDETVSGDCERIYLEWADDSGNKSDIQN